jgi:hypothetical protein
MTLRTAHALVPAMIEIDRARFGARLSDRKRHVLRDCIPLCRILASLMTRGALAGNRLRAVMAGLTIARCPYRQRAMLLRAVVARLTIDLPVPRV